MQMENQEFTNLKELRESRKVSKAKLSKTMNVSAQAIRNWEQGKAIPSVDQMVDLAKNLEVDEATIMKIFMPDKTKVTQDIENEYMLHNVLLELFGSTDTSQKFIQMASLLSATHQAGVVTFEDYVFPFFNIYVEQNEHSVLLMGEDNNVMVFTTNNLVEVIPISMEFNVYTFQVSVCCPLFPSKEKYNPFSFRQTLKVSFIPNNK